MDDQEKSVISRREAIKKAALVFGGVLTTPAALTLLQGCGQPRTSLNGFTDDQRATIETIADIIIPTTDSAGATEAGAVQLMEDILFDIRSEEDRNDFLNKLSQFKADARKKLGTSFVDASADQQLTFVTKVHDEAFAQELGWNDPKPFMWQMKEAIVYAYMGTEVGMTQVHQYIQVPGRYESCVPFSEAGEGNRVWASS